MNQAWQLAEQWQEDRRGGWALSRLIGKLAGRHAGRSSLMLITGCRHSEPAATQGQKAMLWAAEKMARLGCDHRHCGCEDLLKETEEGGEKMRHGSINFQLLMWQRKEKPDLPSLFSPAAMNQQEVEKLKIVGQFQANSNNYTKAEIEKRFALKEQMLNTNEVSLHLQSSTFMR